jgi:Adenylate and Guanylate cyclase catalytic domain
LLQRDAPLSFYHAGLFAGTMIFGEITSLRISANAYIRDADHEAFHQRLVNYTSPTAHDVWDHPHCLVLQPVFETINDPTSRPRALLIASIAWDRYLIDLLPQGTSGIMCVLKNSCGQSFTYKLDGNEAFYLGPGDLHDPNYDHTEVAIPFYSSISTNTTIPPLPGQCLYTYHIYATDELKASYETKIPLVLSLLVLFVFILMTLCFCTFDLCVRRRNLQIVTEKSHSDAIISSLFPSNVRDRLYEQSKTENAASPSLVERPFAGGKFTHAKYRLRTFMTEGTVETSERGESTNHGFMEDLEDVFMYKSKPIADLFPEVTVLFCDICGFTSWSSTRDPTQVFVLLETIYKAFDGKCRL